MENPKIKTDEPATEIVNSPQNLQDRIKRVAETATSHSIEPDLYPLEAGNELPMFERPY